MKFFAAIFCVFLLSSLYAQEGKIPSYYKSDKQLNEKITKLVKDLGLDGEFKTGDETEKISLAVIDLNKKKPVYAGVYSDNFTYPASVYKMFVAAEVLSQISQGKYTLETPFVVKSPNDVDRTKEIIFDPRPLLKDGDTVTVNYLLDLMITRSDNSAANCMIDLADRININKMMKENNWNGSEVTRKFLSRKKEAPGYENVPGTSICALHAADFMYKVYTNKLINPWVSMQLKALLGRQLDKSKLAKGLPSNAMYFHKTGWFSCWTNDVGIVDDGKVKYIVSCFLPIEEVNALPKMKELSAGIYKIMSERVK